MRQRSDSLQHMVAACLIAVLILIVAPVFVPMLHHALRQ